MLTIGATAASAVASGTGSADAQLAERYAPVVVVREQRQACGAGEPYLPTSVDSVLGHPDVVLRGPDGEAIVGPTAADLAGRGTGWYLDLPGSPLSPGCDYETWFRDSSQGRPASVYARVATDPDHPGVLALQYWFWWVYNDWNDRHEGDWEMIQLLFEADSAAAALQEQPVSVAFAQHEGSEVAAWTDAKLVREGDRVVVYPAEGSHAAYFTQSQWFGRSAAAGFGCDDTSAEGDVVDPDVILLDDAQSDWTGFTGRWGERAPSFNNGPTGPITKTQWAHPVTWQEEEGRAEAVALPVVGGPAVDSFCGITRGASLLFIALLENPALVVLGILALLGLALVLVRATRWRHGGDTRPDRERRAGQVVTASVAMLVRDWRALWPLVVVIGLTNAGALALQRLALHRRPTGDIADIYGLANDPVGLGLAYLAVFALAPVVAVGLAATARVVEEVATNRPAEPWRALTWCVRNPSGALAQLGLFLVVTLLATSLVLAPIALWLIAVFAVAMPAAVIERRRLVGAFARSRELTKGRRWRAVFLSALLIWIGFSLPSAIGGVLLLATGWPFWVTNVVAIALGAVLLPFSAIGLTLQYYDFRREHLRDVQKRRESASS